MYRDSGCNSKDGVGAIFDILENNYDMDVIMGPACSPGKPYFKEKERNSIDS